MPNEVIDDWYKYMSYFDIYGGSVLLFIGITAATIFVAVGCRIMKHKEDIAADWINQRCNPKYIPFAGFINKPFDETIFEYTQKNFEFCMQDTTTETTGAMVQPLTHLTDQLTVFYKNLANSLNSMRDALNNARDNTREFTENVMARILNITIPLQRILLAFRDMLGKTQGILTASLFTLLGTYDTLQSLMGAILELIIKLLVALAAVVLGLWATPVTWPAAATASLVFMSISIPLSIIAAFMSSTLHVHSSGLPKLRCFDQETSFMVVRGCDGLGHEKGACMIDIQNIEAGDWIIHKDDAVQVTGKFKVLSSGLDMYQLETVCVSGSHLVRYGNRWIRTSEHPNAKRMKEYANPYVFCLNTASKEIYVGGHRFSDWDESQVATGHQSYNIGMCLDEVYSPDPNVFLYGTVSLLGKRWHALSNTGYFFVIDQNNNRRQVLDYNAVLDNY